MTSTPTSPSFPNAPSAISSLLSTTTSTPAGSATIPAAVRAMPVKGSVVKSYIGQVYEAIANHPQWFPSQRLCRGRASARRFFLPPFRPAESQARHPLRRLQQQQALGRPSQNPQSLRGRQPARAARPPQRLSPFLFRAPGSGDSPHLLFLAPPKSPAFNPLPSATTPTGPASATTSPSPSTSPSLHLGPAQAPHYRHAT